MFDYHQKWHDWVYHPSNIEGLARCRITFYGNLDQFETMGYDNSIKILTNVVIRRKYDFQARTLGREILKVSNPNSLWCQKPNYIILQFTVLFYMQKSIQKCLLFTVNLMKCLWLLELQTTQNDEVSNQENVALT